MAESTFAPHGTSAALSGVAMAGSMLTAFYEADTLKILANAERSLAEAQAHTLDIDIAGVEAQARQKQRVIRRERASEQGAIRTAAAVSGVSVDSGSVAAAMARGAAAGAYEEMIVRSDAQSRIRSIRAEQRGIRRGGRARAQAGRAQARARISQGIGQATSGVGAIVSYMQPTTGTMAAPNNTLPITQSGPAGTSGASRISGHS